LNCQQTSRGKHLFQKKPLGRRWHLMSSSAGSGAANLVSATSGTERERGFVGIPPRRSVPLGQKVRIIINYLRKKEVVLIEKGEEKKMDYRNMITDYMELEMEVLKNLDIDAINEAMNLMMQAYEAKKKIYIFGNGGSSATASHYQNDFNKGISEYVDKKFNFICLNDNVPTIMAIANDIGFEEVFRFQLREKLEEGDIVIAISGSGNSKNVIYAVEYAKEQGNKVIGMTGYEGGKLRELADISLHADVMSMQVTEDIHMIFDHMIMSIFYKTLCGKEHLKKER